MKRLSRLFLLCALLAACAATPPALLKVSPASLGERTVQQMVSISVGQQTQSFDAVVDISDGHLRLVAHTLGLRLLSLDYDGERLQVSDTRLPPDLPAERILNDLLLALAEADALRAALPPGHTLQEGRDDQGAWRRVMHGTRILSEVRYRGSERWQGELTLQHTDAPYRLEIRSEQLP